MKMIKELGKIVLEHFANRQPQVILKAFADGIALIFAEWNIVRSLFFISRETWICFLY